MNVIDIRLAYHRDTGHYPICDRPDSITSLEVDFNYDANEIELGYERKLKLNETNNEIYTEEDVHNADVDDIVILLNKKSETILILEEKIDELVTSFSEFLQESRYDAEDVFKYLSWLEEQIIENNINFKNI